MADSPELKALRVKLAGRKGRLGYEENVREIEQRIAELESEQKP